MKMRDIGFFAVGIVLLAQPALSKFTLTIMHTNDVHARFEQTDKYGGSCSASKDAAGECFGGVARRKTKVNELRVKYPNSLLLDGGDQFQGTLWFTIFRGKAVSYFTNAIGYDAMALGNHEFDLGVDALVPFLQNVSFSVLSSNINTSREPSITGKFQKSTTKVVAGQKIGIIGYTTTDTVEISKSGNLIFEDEAASIQKEVDKLKSEGVDKIIALGHAGYDVDLKIAKTVKGLDVIVGGHSNTFLYTGTSPSNDKPVGDYPTVVNQEDGAKVLVVQDYAFGKYLGFLQVVFDDSGIVESWSGNPILLDNDTAQDATILEELKNWTPALTAARTKVIGRTHVFLDGIREHCRLRECNLGNFIADGMVHQNLDHPDGVYWTRASIGLMNSGGIRTAISKGSVTLEDVLTVSPFRNTIDVFELKGKHIREVLEHSVSKWDAVKQAGRFLQVSGLIVTYDLARPIGARVVSVKARCGDCEMPSFSPLEDEKVYQLVAPTFIIEGGDGYGMIKPNLISRHINGDLDTDVLEEHVRKMSPIAIGLEERIQFVNGSTGGGPCVNIARNTIMNYYLMISAIIMTVLLRRDTYTLWNQ
ncbi:snake venom 5'-nucleotidase-like [Lineus longissimus]|uniref:snake venom 5'-nucleotidase-like n=1 Tax=Lineus longissimus TaxID=88925 RepID=UPI00315D404C